MTEPTWIWPSNEDINDFPDPLGFEDEWHEWEATMAEGPSVYAEIFAREYLQNSWDSIQEQVAKMRSQGHDIPPDHGVTFRFVRLEGPQATAFVEAFQLQGHAARYGEMSERHRRDNRLTGSSVAGGDTAEVRLLVATEICGEGMSGPWKTGGRAGVSSRLKSALMQTKSDKNNQAAGGSWGHGKKAIANASTCRTIAVYSAFEGSAEGDPVRSRFLGVSYWRSHDLGERSHVGLGLLGAEAAETGAFVDQFRPLEDSEAHDFINQLDIDSVAPRDPDVPAQLGTTYVIVEPSFEPADLGLALERNWWPLLERDVARISVCGYEGEDVPLVPWSRPELVPFLEAGQLALGGRDPRERGDDVTMVTTSGLDVGKLALTSDDTEDGWSYADPETNWTLVALIRNDMVIAYERFPGTKRQKGPFIRGVLIVDREENGAASELLKMSEPHLHNIWKAEPSPSVPADSAALAQAVLNRVADRVVVLRRTLKEDDHTVSTHFPVFSQFFTEGRGPSITRPPNPPAPKRPFHILGGSNKRLDANMKDHTSIRAESSVDLVLTDEQLAKGNRLKVAFSPGWKVFEESGGIRDDSLLDIESIEAPDGFEKVENRYVGDLTAVPAKFTWKTEFYPDDWQIAPDPVVTIINAEEEAGA